MSRFPRSSLIVFSALDYNLSLFDNPTFFFRQISLPSLEPFFAPNPLLWKIFFLETADQFFFPCNSFLALLVLVFFLNSYFPKWAFSFWVCVSPPPPPPPHKRFPVLSICFFFSPFKSRSTLLSDFWYSSPRRSLICSPYETLRRPFPPFFQIVDSQFSIDLPPVSRPFPELRRVSPYQ